MLVTIDVDTVDFVETDMLLKLENIPGNPDNVRIIMQECGEKCMTTVISIEDLRIALRKLSVK